MFGDAYKGDNTTGFQSPAQDFIESVVDLSQLLDLKRPNLYPVRVIGQALRERGIYAGDILIADAAADPKAGKVCVAFLDSDVVLATLKQKDGGWCLQPSRGPLRTIKGDDEIWAIITALVRMDV